MHEDARKLCDLSADLGIGLLQASILFATFAGVLWILSKDFAFRVGGTDYAVPGFMLWAAIIYAAAGSLLSYWVGRDLINRNAERYAREADLRFSLVRINEHLDGISLAAGEAHERQRHGGWSSASPTSPGSPRASAGLRLSRPSSSRRRCTSPVRSPSVA
jgi:putative ATP-binding cassette transporter